MRAVIFLTVTAFLGFHPATAADDKGKDKSAAAEAEGSWQVPVTLGKDGWMLYENPRFGFVLPVPPGMKALRPPDNGGGQAFESADGKVNLTCYGSHNVDNLGDVEVRWKEELAEKGRTITYKKKADAWYVVSGVTEEGTGFYTRYSADKAHCAGWTISYPRADEKRLAPWVERIAGGYQPRLGKGQD